MRRLLRLLLVFWAVVFFCLGIVPGVMALFIAIIADYSENVSFGPGCCVNTGSKDVKICFFLGLVLTTTVLSVFSILFFRGLDSVFGAQRVIQGLKGFWSWGLAGLWGWDLGFIRLFVPGVSKLGVDWPISTMTMLVYIMYSRRGLQTGFCLCPSCLCN